MDIALQFGFDLLKVGLDLLNVVLQFGLEDLIVIFQSEFQFLKELRFWSEPG